MPCNAWNHSASCECGWGGVGYGHRASISVPNTSPLHASGVYDTPRHEEARTVPTSCPYCGASVYFYRHENGGCAWFDPPLGPPWPKHDCFYEPSHATDVLIALRPLEAIGDWAALKPAGAYDAEVLAIIRRPTAAQIVVQIPSHAILLPLVAQLRGCVGMSPTASASCRAAPDRFRRTPTTRRRPPAEPRLARSRTCGGTRLER